MDRPDLSVIIVNWKVKNLLQTCINSILVYKDNYKIEIFVIDNDSGDGSVEMINKNYPEVKLIALDKNIGFGAANNLAIKQARADYIFLLNPDTELTKDFFTKIFQYIQNNPNVDIVGPKIINDDGSKQASVRRNPDLFSQILVLLKLTNIAGANKFLEHYFFKDFDYSQEQDVDQIMGAAMFIKRSVFNKIAAFDENFFVWFEEVDLCTRAKAFGLNISYFPGAYIIHHGGVSFSKSNILKKQKMFNKSLLYYFFKHKPLWQTIIILLLLPINIILTLSYVLFRKAKTK
ncbi:MAG: glycosyltransferase family 2 protein [Patescibacteria group bacterium]|jgi:hypothetical protein